MSSDPSPREIQRWYPSKWSEIVGNSSMVKLWKNFIKNGYCNTIFTGPNRTGKTRTISLGISSLLCTARAPTLDPCGKCSSCKFVGEARSSHHGLFSAISGTEYGFHPIDCENVTAEDLENLRLEGDLEKPTTLVYLDEVSVLRSRRLEGKLLKLIDESKATWIASAISLKKKKGKRKGEWTERLSTEMKGRFAIKMGTSLPHSDDLTQWIEDRCRDWNIHIIESEKTIPEMIKRTQRRVGYVIHMLAYAATGSERELTYDDVVSFNLDTLD